MQQLERFDILEVKKLPSLNQFLLLINRPKVSLNRTSIITRGIVKEEYLVMILE